MPTILQLTINTTRPVLRGWDHYWSVIMDFAERDVLFTLNDIYIGSNAKRDDIRGFIKRLKLAGIVEPAGDQAGSFRVLRMQSATPSIRPDGTEPTGVGRHQAMWNTMRSPVCRSGFTADDLVHWGSTDDVPINRNSAKSYIQRLANAGYLVMRQKGTPQRLAIWGLLPEMNSGPDAPKVLRSRLVFDPNNKQVMGDVIAEEEPS